MDPKDVMNITDVYSETIIEIQKNHIIMTHESQMIENNL